MLKGLKKNRNGFLILEILVCVVVITVGLVFIINSFSASTLAITTSRNYITALSLLEDELWEFERKHQAGEGENEGRFGNNENFRWSYEAEEVDETPFNKLIFGASWKQREKTKKVSITTYLWNEED